MHNIKEMLKDKIVTFTRYRKENLYYKTECGFEFPVPINDTGDGEFLYQDKGIRYMRWVRKHLAELEVN